MTDEEKAEENAKTYKIDLCAYCRECEKGSCSHTDDAIFGFKDGYKIGLAEGRKETTEKFSALEKENEELKAQVEQLSNDNYVLKTSFITQREQIEKMKCKNAFYCSDKNSNAIPCYNVYLCRYCPRKEKAE